MQHMSLVVRTQGEQLADGFASAHVPTVCEDGLASMYPTEFLNTHYELQDTQLCLWQIWGPLFGE